MRALAGVLLIGWLTGGLILTLRPVYPLPGQVIDDSWVPFHTIAIYLANLGSWFWMRNLFGNFALLLPIGLLGPVVLPVLDRWWRVALVALAFSAAIELAQYWVPDRSTDIDDLMINTLGALFGYALLTIIRRLASRAVS